MVSKMITEFLGKVRWGELDYLVVDLPPGTGDPSITIARALPRAGAVIVTTPQSVALADVRKAVSMFGFLAQTVNFLH
jgi:ATP-binding protein involved in chromosome partitioning